MDDVACGRLRAKGEAMAMSRQRGTSEPANPDPWRLGADAALEACMGAMAPDVDPETKAHLLRVVLEAGDEIVAWMWARHCAPSVAERAALFALITSKRNVTVAIWWAQHCTPGEAEMAALRELVSEYGDADARRWWACSYQPPAPRV